jgi:hypothetical protein
VQDDDTQREHRDKPLVLSIDATDADWIKGDRVRIGQDGELYVRDLGEPGGTRRIEPSDPDYNAWLAFSRIREIDEEGGTRRVEPLDREGER